MPRQDLERDDRKVDSEIIGKIRRVVSENRQTVIDSMPVDPASARQMLEYYDSLPATRKERFGRLSVWKMYERTVEHRCT